MPSDYEPLNPSAQSSYRRNLIAKREKHYVMQNESGWNARTLFSVFFLLFLATILIIDFTCFGTITKFLKFFEEWLKTAGALGVVTYCIFYFFAMMICIPGTMIVALGAFIFTQIHGFPYGCILTGVVCVITEWLAAQCMFFIGRWLLSDTADVLMAKYKWAYAVDRAFQGHGINLLCLMRLSPLVPFSLFNYVIGATTLSWVPFAFTTIFTFVPLLIICYISSISAYALSASTDVSQSVQVLREVSMWFGIVVTLIAFCLISKYSKEAIDEAMKRIEDSDAKRSPTQARSMTSDIEMGSPAPQIPF